MSRMYKRRRVTYELVPCLGKVRPGIGLGVTVVDRRPRPPPLRVMSRMYKPRRVTYELVPMGSKVKVDPVWGKTSAFIRACERRRCTMS